MAVYQPGSREEEKAFDKAVKLAEKALRGKLKPLQEAAEAGDAYAQERLANVFILRGIDAYDKGDQTYADEAYAQAAKWGRLSAEQGYYVAVDMMAASYYKSIGVQQDLYQAKAWYQKLADIEAQNAAYFNAYYPYQAKNGLDARTALQKLQEVQNDINAFEAAEAAKKPKVDVVELAQKAEKGDAQAQMDLGLIYFQGNGVPQDYAKAAQWFTKAAEQGHGIAQNNMGSLYYTGRGVAKDLAKAAEWWQKAAKQGLDAAQKALGDCYRDGTGVNQDFAKAAEWYQKAADQGERSAMCGLGKLYHKGQGVKQDTEKALALWQKAADQGDATAAYNLGIIYLEGEGAPQDYQKAIAYLEKAVSQGEASAQEPLNAARERFAGQQKAANGPKRIFTIACTVVLGIIGLILGGFFGLIIFAAIGVFAGSFVWARWNKQILSSPLGKALGGK